MNGVQEEKPLEKSSVVHSERNAERFTTFNWDKINRFLYKMVPLERISCGKSYDVMIHEAGIGGTIEISKRVVII